MSSYDLYFFPEINLIDRIGMKCLPMKCYCLLLFRSSSPIKKRIIPFVLSFIYITIFEIFEVLKMLPY